LYLSDLPKPPDGVLVTTYADDITPLSGHAEVVSAQTQLQPYLDKLDEWLILNDLNLNPEKCTSTLFSLDPSERNCTLSLTIKGKVIPTVTNPKVLGITFDRYLTYGEHITTATNKAKSSLNALKAISSKDWGKQKETLITTYKAITRPHLEYGCTIWGPVVSNTNMKKLQTVQNSALRIATGCTKDTSTDNLHREATVLPISSHIKLHSSLYKQKAESPSHPSHHISLQTLNKRHIKQTIFDNTNNFTINLPVQSDNVEDSIIKNCKTIHSEIVKNSIDSLKPNKLLQSTPPLVDCSETTLPRKDRCTLAQIRSGKSSLLMEYLHKVNPQKYTSPLCPLCSTSPHDSQHLFTCNLVPTTLTPIDLWTNPTEAIKLVHLWKDKIGNL
jgi:hypothetical protein